MRDGVKTILKTFLQITQKGNYKNSFHIFSKKCIEYFVNGYIYGNIGKIAIRSVTMFESLTSWYKVNNYNNNGPGSVGPLFL